MRNVFMVHVGPTGSVFVKSYDFFSRGGGFSDDWGLSWQPLVAEGIEDARKKACALLPGARPYEKQAE